MAKKIKGDNSPAIVEEADTAKQRRALLKRLGRFAAVSAPTVTLMLAAKAKPGNAAVMSCVPSASSRALKTRIGHVDGDAVLGAVKKLRIRTRA